jgi:hypothetical protein
MMPEDVSQSTDGTYLRGGLRVCEDCWQVIPRYVDFPRGLVSPESDGDHGGNFAKRRPMAVADKMGVEALQKVVCLGCYLAAFDRMYPGAKAPTLRSDVFGTPDIVATTLPTVPETFVESVRV